MENVVQFRWIYEGKECFIGQWPINWRFQKDELFQFWGGMNRVVSCCTCLQQVEDWIHSNGEKHLSVTQIVWIKPVDWDPVEMGMGWQNSPLSIKDN